MTAAAFPSNRVLRLAELMQITGLSRTSVYSKLNPKSLYHDSSFPKPLKLGAKAVGWLESDVQTWINNRVQQSRTA